MLNQECKVLLNSSIKRWFVSKCTLQKPHLCGAAFEKKKKKKKRDTMHIY